MKGNYKIMAFVVFVIAYLFIHSPISSAELIEPTRALGEEEKGPGRLTVLSEPPGLKITLDGNNLGKTPVFLVEVDEGIHTLHVKNSKTQIYIEPGKTLKISLHKGKFILIPVAEEKVEKEPEIKENTVRKEPKITKPRDPIRIQTETNRRKAIDRFQQFTDGRQEHF
jgi:hypothetical protein